MPTVLLTKKIVDAFGPLPIKKPFVLSADAIGALFVSGSVFSKSNVTQLSIDVTVDGESIGRPVIFANPSLTHMALVPEIIPVNLSSGNHVVGLAALSGTFSDRNDVFTVTLMYAREINRRAVKTSRAVKTPRKRS